MSRTIHKMPSHYYQRMKVQNRRKSEENAVDQLKTEDLVSRHWNRLRAWWSIIPNPWDDHRCSAWKEYQNKNFYRR